MGFEDIMIDVSRRRYEARHRLRQVFSDTVAAVLMIAAALVAIVMANTALSEPLHHLMMTPIGFTFGDTFVGLTLELFVNDLLMAVFFLLVGCDLKYQMTVGALAQPKQAILPMVAAVGGVCGPCPDLPRAQPGRYPARLGHPHRHGHRLCAGGHVAAG